MGVLEQIKAQQASRKPLTGYQVMPELSADDFANLKADISARGVLVPVEYDEDGNVLDGHHRIRACKELKIPDWPRLIREGLSEGEKRVHARQLNIARRHLNTLQKRDLIADQLRETPDQSDRQIAAGLGVDHKTVGGVRGDMGATGEIPQLDKTVGKDGRARSKPKKTKYVDNSEAGRAGTKEVAKEIRAEQVEVKRAAKIEQANAISARNAELPQGDRKYGVIYADPPWAYEVWSGAGKDRAAENHFPTMTLESILAMPVERLAADDCALFLWAVMPQLPDALEVIKAWGFEYKTCAFVYVKTTQDGERPATGMGYWTRANAEICLLATRGAPVRLNADVHQVVQTPRLEHSQKPEEVAARIERLVLGPYIELFSRGSRDGWDVWGNQAVSESEAA